MQTKEMQIKTVLVEVIIIIFKLGWIWTKRNSHILMIDKHSWTATLYPIAKKICIILSQQFHFFNKGKLVERIPNICRAPTI